MAWTQPPRTWVTDEVPTAATLNTHIRDQLAAIFPAGPGYTSYTPAITTYNLGSGTVNPTLGSGSSQVGYYLQTGRMVSCIGYILFGTSGAAAGTGGYMVNVPIAAQDTGIIAGAAHAFDASANYTLAHAMWQDSTHISFRYAGANLVFSQSQPFAWGNNCGLRWNITYYSV